MSLSTWRRSIAVSVRVGRGEKHHFLPANELDHPVGEPVANLPLVELPSPLLAFQLGLYLLLSGSSVIHSMTYESD